MCRSRNAETKIKRLLSKHLAPGSAPVSGFGVMICFVVSIWFWCWIFGLWLHRNLLPEQCGGGHMGVQAGECRQQSDRAQERFMWLQWHNSNQLPADSTLQNPLGAWRCSGTLDSHWTTVVVSLLSPHWCCDFDSFIRHQRDLWWAGESRGTPEVLNRNCSDPYAMPEFILNPVSLSEWCTDK